MKQVTKILSVFFVLLLSCYVIILVIDILGVIKAPENYRIAQGFPEGELSYKSTSVQKYLFKELILLLSIIGVIVLTILKLKNKLNKLWKYIYYVIIVLFISIVLVGYYNWMKTGFDH